MATALVNPKFRAWNGDKPLAFGKVYTYAAGTNIPKPTYTSEDETVVNPNPVILNAEGYADIYLDGSYKVVVKDEDDVEVWTADPVTDITTVGNEWVHPTSASKYDANRFTVDGNQVDRFHIGRRVKLDDTGYLYGDIIEAYYDGQGRTIVTIELDSGNLTDNLNQAYVGIISAINGSQPANKYLQNLQGDQGTDYIKYASDKTLTQKLNEQDAEDQNLQGQIDQHASDIGQNAADIASANDQNATKFTGIESDILELQNTISTGVKLTYRTRADLYADLAHDEDTVAEVILDSTPEYNGTYIKNGASGTGSWSIASYDRYQNAISNSKKGRYEIIAKFDKFKINTDNSIVVSWARLYLYDGSSSGVKKIAAVSNLNIPNGQGAYIDLDAGLNGSGEYDVNVGAVTSSATFGTNGFINDNKFMLLYCNSGIIGGMAWKGFGETISEIARYEIIGEAEKIVRDDVNSQILLTCGDLQVFKGADGSGPLTIPGVTDLAIPNLGAAYIDLDDSPLQIKVSSNMASEIQVSEKKGFVYGRKVILLANTDMRYGRLGGPLADRETYQSKIRPMGNFFGKVDKASLSGNDLTVSWGRLYVFEGAGKSLHKIEAVNDLVIGNGMCAYIDLNEAKNGSDEYVVHVTTTGFQSGTENGYAGFVRDGKVILLANSSNIFGGLLADSVNSQFLSDPWLGHVIMRTPGTNITFDVATRVLAWDDVIFLQFRNGQRIKLGAGSVTFPDAGQLQVAWLDMNQLNYTETPASAVKVGRYYTGTDMFLANQDQVPLFFYNSGEFGPIGGFPVPSIVGAVSDQADDDLFVVHSSDEINIYKKGLKPGSDKYIRIRIAHSQDLVNADFDKRHDAWRMEFAYEATKTGDFSFSTGEEICNGGEWECAIKQVGKPDFMGGKAHGNEFQSDVYILVDGVERSIANTGNYVCKRFELIQKSILTEDGTSNAVTLANKHTHWDISQREMVLEHNVQWVANVDLNEGYLCMLPIKRLNNAKTLNITDTGARYPAWRKEDMSVDGFTMVTDDSNHAKIWGSSSGISADVEVVEGWDLPNREFKFSNAVQYNKIYFDFCGIHSVTNGDVWNTKAIYKLDTAN